MIVWESRAGEIVAGAEIAAIANPASGFRLQRECLGRNVGLGFEMGLLPPFRCRRVWRCRRFWLCTPILSVGADVLARQTQVGRRGSGLVRRSGPLPTPTVRFRGNKPARLREVRIGRGSWRRHDVLTPIRSVRAGVRAGKAQIRRRSSGGRRFRGHRPSPVVGQRTGGRAVHGHADLRT